MTLFKNLRGSRRCKETPERATELQDKPLSLNVAIWRDHFALEILNDFVNVRCFKVIDTFRSALNLYRALIELRKTTPDLVVGSYAPVATAGDLLAYKREYAGNALLIVLNLGADPISIGPDTMAFPGEILLSTYLDRSGETASGGLDLRGNEGLIIRLR